MELVYHPPTFADLRYTKTLIHPTYLDRPPALAFEGSPTVPRKPFNLVF